MQRLRNLRFICRGAIAVRGVDQVHAEFERAMQDALRVATVPGHSPGVGSAQPHRAEPHAIYRKVAEPDRIAPML